MPANFPASYAMDVLGCRRVLRLPRGVMPNEKGLSCHEMENGCVSNCIKIQIQNIQDTHPGYTIYPGSVYQNCIQDIHKCLALDEGPMDVLRLRPCPDHGRFIADVGCSSSLCSASIAQQRLPCILAQ